MTAHLIGIVGNPGEGKSWMARSACALGKTAVALLDPKEEAFYAPAKPALVEVFFDAGWLPHKGQYHATGYSKLLGWLDARASDDSTFVIVDPASDITNLAMHDTLKLHNPEDPSSVANGRAWIGHNEKVKAFVIALQRLYVAGKTVVCTFHGEMSEYEGTGDAKRVDAWGKDKTGAKLEDWEFPDQMLPAIMGRGRQHIHKAFDLWLYTKPSGYGPGRRYMVTAVADQVRPAKHSVTFKPGANAAMLSNDMKALLEAIA